MTARSTRGVRILMTTATAAGVDITPTGISSAAPAVVTAASVSGVTAGDLIVIPAGATGMPSLDGHSFTVASVDSAGSTFDLLGTDTTGETYAAGTPATIQQYDSTQFVNLCFASLTRNAGTASTTSVATYCDPTATLASPVVEAGSFDFTGYIDVTASDYQEIVKAFDDGDNRHFVIELPGANGAVVFDGTVSSLDLDLPVDGALGYSGSITLAGRPIHLF